MLQKALSFLQEHNEVSFATCEGCLPKIRVFQIMRQEGTTLYFATSERKEVWRELQQNPHVELLAYADNVSVRCRGEVRFEVDDETKQWIYDNNAVLSRLYSSWESMAYFSLPIAELDYYDLSPTPPVFKHFDIASGAVSDGFVGERYSKK